MCNNSQNFPPGQAPLPLPGDTDKLVKLNENLSRQLMAEVARNRDKDHLLLSLSRQAMIGTLVGNLAHEWRQPMNALGLLLANIHEASRQNRLTPTYTEKAFQTGQRLIQGMNLSIGGFAEFILQIGEQPEYSLRKQNEQTVALLAESFKRRNIGIHLPESADFMVSGNPGDYSLALLSVLFIAKEAILRGPKGAATIEISIREGDRSIGVSVRLEAGGRPIRLLDDIENRDPISLSPAGESGVSLFVARQLIARTLGGHLETCVEAGGAELTIFLPHLTHQTAQES